MKAFRGMDLSFEASLRRVLDEGVRQLHAATIFPGVKSLAATNKSLFFRSITEHLTERASPAF
jgi:hypothetical protein